MKVRRSNYIPWRQCACRQSYLGCVLSIAALLSNGSVTLLDAESVNDHLQPVIQSVGETSAYRDLTQKMLFTTPGAVARFIQLPGSQRSESAISIYRDSKKPGGLPGGFWLTKTEPSTPIFTGLGQSNAAVQIKRCDAPLPESTAKAIHELWIRMLKGTKALKDPERYLPIDSTTEIFSALDGTGKVLEGEAPQIELDEDGRVNSMLRIAFGLLDYCDLRPGDRLQFARKLQKRATRATR